MAIWNWFQRTADRIDKWQWSPEMAKTIQSINDKIPPVIAKAVIGYLKVQYNKSEDLAKASLKSVKVKLNEIVEENIK